MLKQITSPGHFLIWPQYCSEISHLCPEHSKDVLKWWDGIPTFRDDESDALRMTGTGLGALADGLAERLVGGEV